MAYIMKLGTMMQIIMVYTMRQFIKDYTIKQIIRDYIMKQIIMVDVDNMTRKIQNPEIPIEEQKNGQNVLFDFIFKFTIIKLH